MLLRTGASQAATFALPATIESVLCVDGDDVDDGNNNDVDVDADVARVLPVRRKTPTSDISKKSGNHSKQKCPSEEATRDKKGLGNLFDAQKKFCQRNKFPAKNVFRKSSGRLFRCFSISKPTSCRRIRTRRRRRQRRAVLGPRVASKSVVFRGCGGG